MEDEIVYFFGNKIRELRTAKGLSQEELAYKAHLSTTFLGKIERGVNNPTLKSIYQISVALGVPLSDIFSDTPVEINDPVYDADTEKLLRHIQPMSSAQKRELLRLISVIERFSKLE